MSQPILRAAGIQKTYFTPRVCPILTKIDLEAHPGESIAITGRSGSGKTTLLHILGTLESFDAGTLEIQGRSVTPSERSTLRNHTLGFVFQSFNLLDDFTALDNVLMPARIARTAVDRSYGHALLEKVGLADRADHPAKLLSGGEKQRVAIARALCNRPKLLFADEPSGNLDQQTASAISALLFDLVKAENKTLILVTHDFDLASRCNRRLILSNGVLAKE